MLIINRVLENQQSPLLRLPREIRDCIWKYALGGKVFLMKEHVDAERFEIVPENAASDNNALLRTCRQIYSEASSFPLRFGTIACLSPWAFVPCIKTLTRHQRAQVTKLCLTCCCPHDMMDWDDGDLKSCRCKPEYYLPSLTQIEIFVHGVENENDTWFQNKTESIRECLKRTLERSGCELLLRGTPEKMQPYLCEA